VEDVNDGVQERRLAGESKKDEEEVIVGDLISLVWLWWSWLRLRREMMEAGL
jgi:hypothetical protein